MFNSWPDAKSLEDCAPQGAPKRWHEKGHRRGHEKAGKPKAAI
jgi:hypothetical protein